MRREDSARRSHVGRQHRHERIPRSDGQGKMYICPVLLQGRIVPGGRLWTVADECFRFWYCIAIFVFFCRGEASVWRRVFRTTVNERLYLHDTSRLTYLAVVESCVSRSSYPCATCNVHACVARTAVDTSVFPETVVVLDRSAIAAASYPDGPGFVGAWPGALIVHLLRMPERDECRQHVGGG